MPQITINSLMTVQDVMQIMIVIKAQLLGHITNCTLRKAIIAFFIFPLRGFNNVLLSKEGSDLFASSPILQLINYVVATDVPT